MPDSIFDDLYRYNGWANQKLFNLCEGLSDSQLDQPREMGLGSLRNTLFHIVFVEELWLERWQQKPWRALSADSGGATLTLMKDKFDAVAAERQQLIETHRSARWQIRIDYKDSRGNPYQNSLDEMLLHVVNHGIHHRAQALSYLKNFGRTVRGGLDYLFYKIANPSQPQDADSVQKLRERGLDTASGSSSTPEWDPDLVRNWFAYSDWANDRLKPLIETMSPGQLDLDQNLGVGTLRKTTMHLFDAERWWYHNWTQGPTNWSELPSSTSLVELSDLESTLRADRNRFLEGLTQATSSQPVTAIVPGGPRLTFALIESALQLCGHGSHHRAQLLNMLRREGQQPPGIDYILWRRERNPPAG